MGKGVTLQAGGFVAALTLLLALAIAAPSTQQAESTARWKRPQRCVERIPARTLPKMSLWGRHQPAQVIASDDCDFAKQTGGTCVCIDQAGIDAATGCCPYTKTFDQKLGAVVPPYIKGGVCSCEDHVVKCCDGTTSPNCTCRRTK
jgi:hypothetical protein